MGDLELILITCNSTIALSYASVCRPEYAMEEMHSEGTGPIRLILARLPCMKACVGRDEVAQSALRGTQEVTGIPTTKASASRIMHIYSRKGLARNQPALTNSTNVPSEE